MFFSSTTDSTFLVDGNCVIFGFRHPQKGDEKGQDKRREDVHQYRVAVAHQVR